MYRDCSEPEVLQYRTEQNSSANWHQSGSAAWHGQTVNDELAAQYTYGPATCHHPTPTRGAVPGAYGSNPVHPRARQCAGRQAQG
ncbi:hypothetical protein RHGRI_016491 [Rhododendron griersonianum]|uniref:Uncharacterized protein n=1 Tax=Rhododendron griersonianum TaxID=479676 RepID=A0AAV6JUC1_9ERIC|nr:hypothetical protein RHGRI_016491 [Rhododendron griersonianum]